jgi:hypothetical protein
MSITPRWGQPVDDLDLKRKVAFLQVEVKNLTKQLELMTSTFVEDDGTTTGALVHGNELHNPDFTPQTQHDELRSDFDAHAADTNNPHETRIRNAADYDDSTPPDVGQAPVWNGALWVPGAAIPAPSLPGQVFMSLDGTTYAWEVPVTSPDGWLVGDDDTMLVEG